jgi:hypothetical protein
VLVSQLCVQAPLCEGDAQEEPPKKETTDERFHSSKPVWWACQDLNLGPHPYQAYSADAFKQLER